MHIPYIWGSSTKHQIYKFSKLKFTVNPKPEILTNNLSMSCIMGIFQSTCEIQFSMFRLSKNKRQMGTALTEWILWICGKMITSCHISKINVHVPTFLFFGMKFPWDGMQCTNQFIKRKIISRTTKAFQRYNIFQRLKRQMPNMKSRCKMAVT